MQRRRAFTLIELTLVIAILAVLAALVLPRFADATQDAAETAAQTNLAIIQRQVDHYHGMTGQYPDDLLAQWFVGGSLPLNPMAENDTPGMVEVHSFANPSQTEPADKTMSGPAVRPWWYNPITGQVRARVKALGSPVETLRLYNRINGVDANTLGDITARRVTETNP